MLGFSNRWYAHAVETAQVVALSDRLSIGLVTATAFVATKREAFVTRGNSDFLSSHDLEDVLNVVDGRTELVEEFAVEHADLRQWVADVFAGLVDTPAFVNALPGMVAEPARASIVLQRLRAIASAWKRGCLLRSGRENLEAPALACDDALQLQRTGPAMKSASLPSLRVDPALREAAEAVLQEGETLSSFVEHCVRAQVQQRQQQEAFIARGLASRDSAKASNRYIDATDVLAGLQSQLHKARKG